MKKLFLTIGFLLAFIANSFPQGSPIGVIRNLSFTSSGVGRILGDWEFNGDVTFFGTTTIDGPLNINFTTSENLKIYDSDSDSLIFGPSGFSATNSAAAGVVAFQYKDGSTNLVSVDTNTVEVVFKAGGVGIGTDSPAAQVEIEGTSAALLIDDDNNPFIQFNKGANQVGLLQISATDIFSLHGRVNASADMQFYVGATQSIPELHIDAGNSNVGIGTAAPGAELQLGDGTGNEHILINKDDVNTAEIIFQSEGGTSTEFRLTFTANENVEYRLEPNKSMDFYTFNLLRFRIQNDGNIGIGTTAPASGLEMGNDLLFAQDVNAGLTASTTQTQAGGLDLTAQVNEVSTVANASDTVVLPALPATGSLMCVIINNGANAMRVFPASGDDLGTGVDTADAVDIPTATTRIYISYDGTNWEKYLSE